MVILFLYGFLHIKEAHIKETNTSLLIYQSAINTHIFLSDSWFDCIDYLSEGSADAHILLESR